MVLTMFTHVLKPISDPGKFVKVQLLPALKFVTDNETVLPSSSLKSSYSRLLSKQALMAIISEFKGNL